MTRSRSSRCLLVALVGLLTLAACTAGPPDAATPVAAPLAAALPPTLAVDRSHVVPACTQIAGLHYPATVLCLDRADRMSGTRSLRIAQAPDFAVDSVLGDTESLGAAFHIKAVLNPVTHQAVDFNWNIEFGGPAAQPFPPGIYSHAGIHDPHQPRLNIETGAGDCPGFNGWFQLLEFAYDADGDTVTRFAANFDFSCPTDQYGPTRGTLLYNAGVDATGAAVPGTVPLATATAVRLVPPGPATLAAPECAAALLGQPTGVCLRDPNGVMRIVLPAQAPIQGQGGPDFMNFTARRTPQYWILMFEAPMRGHLIPGLYANAADNPGPTGARPRIRITTTSIGCDQQGRFEVLENTIDAQDATHNHMAVNFEVSCGADDPPTRGSVLYNATISPTGAPLAGSGK